MSKIADLTRTMLRIRETRHRASAGPYPRLHGYIYFDRFRMRVTTNPTAEYWHWLTLAGWREIQYPRDRRTYITLPEGSFKLLSSRTSASREQEYISLIQAHEP